MTKKKKTAVESQPLSENAQRYFDLWLKLNISHDEFEMDDRREEMNELWTIMTKQEKREFHLQSGAYEKRNRFD